MHVNTRITVCSSKWSPLYLGFKYFATHPVYKFKRKHVTLLQTTLAQILLCEISNKIQKKNYYFYQSQEYFLFQAYCYVFFVPMFLLLSHKNLVKRVFVNITENNEQPLVIFYLAYMLAT